MNYNTAVISDASCLIALDNINHLNILNECFSEVFVTPEVATEFENPLPDFITVKAIQNTEKKKELLVSLDNGEASAIALALEMSEATLIIDEKGKIYCKKVTAKNNWYFESFVNCKEKECYNRHKTTNFCSTKERF